MRDATKKTYAGYRILVESPYSLSQIFYFFHQLSDDSVLFSELLILLLQLFPVLLYGSLHILKLFQDIVLRIHSVHDLFFRRSPDQPPDELPVFFRIVLFLNFQDMVAHLSVLVEDTEQLLQTTPVRLLQARYLDHKTVVGQAFDELFSAGEFFLGNAVVIRPLHLDHGPIRATQAVAEEIDTDDGQGLFVPVVVVVYILPVSVLLA